MSEDKKFVIDKATFEYSNDEINFYKMSAFGKMKLKSTSKIKDIEILNHSTKINSICYDTPYLLTPIQAAAKSDADKAAVEEFYNFLIEHGVIDRQLGYFESVYRRHSITEAENKVRKQNAKEERKEKIKKAIEDAEREDELKRKRSKWIEHKEEQYTCLRCGEKWYANSDDKILNFSNSMLALNGSAYGANNIKQIDRCPKCGSNVCNHKTVRFWTNSKGEVMEYEE